MGHVLPKDSLEVPTPENVLSVQALPADCAHELLGEGVRSWGPWRGTHDARALGSKHVVEGTAQSDTEMEARVRDAAVSRRMRLSPDPRPIVVSLGPITTILTCVGPPTTRNSIGPGID